VELLRAAGAEPVAVLIALDRMERAGSEGALTEGSAVEEFARQYGIPVLSVASLADLMKYLDSSADEGLRAHRQSVVHYRQRYGV
jgi:orotate phosphoribosyltransferase